MKPLILSPAAQTEPLHMLGHQIFIRLATNDTDGTFTLFEQHSLPGSSVALHYHRTECETFHVLAGQVEFTVGETQRSAGPGTTLYVPANTRHALRVVGTDVARMLIFTAPSGIENMFRKLAALPPNPTPQQVNAISSQHGIDFV